ncbi:hypothetical protein RSAG8_07957, partial [Rhizoctonia solani AG-8 WAC10335]
MFDILDVEDERSTKLPLTAQGRE